MMITLYNTHELFETVVYGVRNIPTHREGHNAIKMQGGYRTGKLRKRIYSEPDTPSVMGSYP